MGPREVCLFMVRILTCFGLFVLLGVGWACVRCVYFCSVFTPCMHLYACYLNPCRHCPIFHLHINEKSLGINHFGFSLGEWCHCFLNFLNLRNQNKCQCLSGLLQWSLFCSDLDEHKIWGLAKMRGNLILVGVF